jgi:UDP-N-acetylmuramate dehydrogenase
LDGGLPDSGGLPGGAGGLDSFADYAAALVPAARAAGVPVFFLGAGANIVVSDDGFRGIVLDMGGNTGTAASSAVSFFSGTSVDEAVGEAAARGLSGLEFLAGMPGSIGGALWMNARCYEKSVSDVFVSAEVLDFGGPGQGEAGGGAARRLTVSGGEGFGYKRSPFQARDVLILSGSFALQPRPEAEIRAEMAKNRSDREKKGHYRYPSAGSAFKNNREFGKPTGKIIDELGLRGFSVGGAQVAPWHGNIIINTGGAKAAEIRILTEKIQQIVREKTGFSLECEILFINS